MFPVPDQHEVPAPDHAVILHDHTELMKLGEIVSMTLAPDAYAGQSFLTTMV